MACPSRWVSGPSAPRPRRELIIRAIDRQVAERSMLIKNMMEDLGEEAISTAVPIPNVSTHPQDVMPPFTAARGR